MGKYVGKFAAATTLDNLPEAGERTLDSQHPATKRYKTEVGKLGEARSCEAVTAVHIADLGVTTQNW